MKRIIVFLILMVNISVAQAALEVHKLVIMFML